METWPTMPSARQMTSSNRMTFSAIVKEKQPPSSLSPTLSPSATRRCISSAMPTSLNRRTISSETSRVKLLCARGSPVGSKPSATRPVTHSETLIKWRPRTISSGTSKVTQLCVCASPVVSSPVPTRHCTTSEASICSTTKTISSGISKVNRLCVCASSVGSSLAMTVTSTTSETLRPGITRMTGRATLRQTASSTAIS